MDLWLSDTYDVGEILECLQAPGPWQSSPCVAMNHTGFYEGLNVTVHEVSSGYGRCYAIHFSSYLLTNNNMFFSIKFNMSQHRELFVYIHEDYNEVGQHWGYYPILPIQAIIARNAHYTFSVKKNQFRPFDNGGCRKEEDYSYPECVVTWTRRRYVEVFEENNKTGRKGSLRKCLIQI